MSIISPRLSNETWNKRLSEVSSYNSEVEEAFLDPLPNTPLPRISCREILAGTGISCLSILIGIAAFATFRHICETTGSSIFAGSDWTSTILAGVTGGAVLGGGVSMLSRKPVVIGAAFGSGMISAFVVVFAMHMRS